MGFLKNAIKSGIAEGISQSVGKAVEEKIAPKVKEYADAAADHIQATTDAVNESAAATREAVGEMKKTPEGNTILDNLGLGGSFANLEEKATNLALEIAKNTKVCPECGEECQASREFCSNCGAKLPEETMADGYVCPECGLQNMIDTKFCAACGAVLPAKAEEVAQDRAEAEERAKYEAEEKAREAARLERQAKLDAEKQKVADLKNTATDLGGQAADAALDAAAALFGKFGKKKK